MKAYGTVHRLEHFARAYKDALEPDFFIVIERGLISPPSAENPIS